MRLVGDIAELMLSVSERGGEGVSFCYCNVQAVTPPDLFFFLKYGSDAFFPVNPFVL